MLDRTDRFEVRTSSGVQVDDSDAHRLPFADPGELRPIGALAKVVSIAHRDSQALHVNGFGQ
jgi:hypothetical protein